MQLEGDAGVLVPRRYASTAARVASAYGVRRCHVMRAALAHDGIKYEHAHLVLTRAAALIVDVVLRVVSSGATTAAAAPLPPRLDFAL